MLLLLQGTAVGSSPTLEQPQGALHSGPSSTCGSVWGLADRWDVSWGPHLLCTDRGRAYMSLYITEGQEGWKFVCCLMPDTLCCHLCVCCMHLRLWPLPCKLSAQCVWASPGHAGLPFLRRHVCYVLCRFAGASLQSAWLSGRDLADRLAALRGKTPEQVQQLAIGLQEQFVPLAEATSSAAEIGEFPGCKVPAAASPAPQQRRPQQQQRQPQQRQPQQQQVQGGGGGPRQQRAPAQQRAGR